MKVTAIALVATLSGCVSTPVKEVEQRQAIEISDTSIIKPIAITKVAGKMRRGTDIGDIQGGLLCVRMGDITWRSGSKVNLTSDELADVFTRFYDQCPVLNSKFRDSRLFLCKMTRQVLAAGLDMLGIDALSEM